MKKIVYLILVILLIVGCNNKVEENDLKSNQKENIINEEPKEKIPEYVDTNPIKIAFYKKENGVYKRLDKYYSYVDNLKEIGVFSIVLSNDEEVAGTSIKSLYNKLSSNIDDFSNYKIGFNIKFTLNDGKTINENILRPIEYSNYGFCHYLYAWIYDDINTTGWHSHIEEDEFDDNTVMSSIKLMWGKTASDISSPVELTVFTYDSDDFDEEGNYRGISKWTTIIEKE